MDIKIKIILTNVIKIKIRKIIKLDNIWIMNDG